MKSRVIRLAIVMALVLTAILPTAALAQNPAYDTAFTTSITYMNVDTVAAQIQILFYASPDTVTPITIPMDDLPAGAGTSVFIGNLGDIDPGFQGGAVMLSDAQVVSTLVQVPQGSTTVKNRPLSNGFSAGSPVSLIATVLKNTFNSTTRFSVQNADSEMNTVTIHYYDTSANEVYSQTQDIESSAAFFVDAGTLDALGASFNGSAVVESKRADDTDGLIVTTAMELSTTSTGASAFEGVATGSMKYFMASALCGYFNQNTSYAIQNTSLISSTNVLVTFTDGTDTFTDTKEIGPGAKASFVGCDVLPAGFIGSAIVDSDTTEIIAIGKVYGGGLSTAFVGAPAGAAKLALPYVRWSETQYLTGQRQRTFIAIQNVGDAEIPAGSITVSYVDKVGAEVTAQVIDTALTVGGKVSRNPFFDSDPLASEFGYYADGTFGGSVIITCTAPGCQLVAIARVQSHVVADNSNVAEDYNGIVVP